MLKLARAKTRGAHVNLLDIVRWRQSRRLRAEPLIRIEASSDGLKLWPARGFQNGMMLQEIVNVFGNFGFAVQHHSRRLSKREYRSLLRSWSEKLVSQTFPDGTTHYFKVPLLVRETADEATYNDLVASLTVGPEWKSLSEIREIVGSVRVRHLHPGKSNYEYFM